MITIVKQLHNNEQILLNYDVNTIHMCYHRRQDYLYNKYYFHCKCYLCCIQQQEQGEIHDDDIDIVTIDTIRNDADLIPIGSSENVSESVVDVEGILDEKDPRLIALLSVLAKNNQVDDLDSDDDDDDDDTGMMSVGDDENVSVIDNSNYPEPVMLMMPPPPRPK